MRKNFLLLIFALLGTVAWAGVQTTYVVTQTSGTLYFLDSPGNYSNWESGFGCKYVSSDGILTFSPQDNTVNWGYTFNSGFRINHQGSPKSSETQIDANAIVSYTLTVPDNYTIVSYSFGAAPNGANSNAMEISTNSGMTDAVTVQKGSEVTVHTETVNAKETTFYLRHKNGAVPIDVTLSVVVEAPAEPKEAVEEYLTDDKIANVKQAGQYGYPKTTTQTYKDIKSIVDKLTQPDAIWTQADYDNVQTYYDAYIAETNVVVPEAGKFYRIYVDNGERRKYLSANGTGVNGTTSTAFDASYIWYFNESSQFTAFHMGYQINGVALGCNNGTTTAFTKASNAFGKLNVQSGDKQWFIQISMEDDQALKTGGANLPGAYFSFEEVDQLPLTLNEVDGMYYATLTLPVDVTLEGASAYAPTLNENNYFICENGQTEVPANTPVILIGEGENATANINATASTAETTNKLSGTIQAIVNPEGQNVYVLSVDGDNNLGFYKYEGTNIPGFKAYYTDTATEANGFVLNFADDNITGIVSAENAAAAAQTHYDLQGRRVEAPQKGQLYIVNGKKVLY